MGLRHLALLLWLLDGEGERPHTALGWGSCVLAPVPGRPCLAEGTRRWVMA